MSGNFLESAPRLHAKLFDTEVRKEKRLKVHFNGKELGRDVIVTPCGYSFIARVHLFSFQNGAV